MRKSFKFLIIFIIILFLGSIVYFTISHSNTTESKSSISNSEKEALILYINDIYNKLFSIPEFSNINEADEIWLWENINQYLNNHSEFEERNLNCDYTYEEISSFAKTLYGDDLTKACPTGNEVMLYNEETNTYGVPSFSFDNFFEYQIESIEKNDNIYTVKIIDYAVSFWEHLGDNPTNHTNFFNITEYYINGELSEDIIFYVTELNNYRDKILENKEKFTSKTLIIEYDTATQNYHIKSCKYNYSDEDILKKYYHNMLETFNFYNLEYDPNEFTTSSKAEIKNFEKLTSIYTNNGLETYKNTFELLSFADNKAFIEAGDFWLLEYLHSTEFSNIQKTENELTCTVTSTLLNDPFKASYPPSENDLNLEKFVATFKLVKENDTWKIDQFNCQWDREI